MTRPKGSARDLVHTPGDLSSAYVKWAKRIQEDPGIAWGVPCIDRKVIPMRPGEFVGICGRPGMGKSSILRYLARTEAARIIERGRQDKEAVIYVTWEEAPEVIEGALQANADYSVSDVAWGRVPLDTIIANSAGRAGIPIWIIGNGIGRIGRSVPRMTPEVVLSAIESMAEEWNGVRPRLMLFDYLQNIPVQRSESRTQQVTQAAVLIKETALRVGAPAVAAVQASRDVDSLKLKIPGLGHMQWASGIEQTVDKAFGLWRPVLTEQDRPPVRVNGRVYPITPELLIMRCNKQRGEEAGFLWALHFKPQYLELAEIVNFRENGEVELPYWAD